MARLVACDRCKIQCSESVWKGQLVELDGGTAWELCSTCITALRKWVTEFTPIRTGHQTPYSIPDGP